MSLHIVKLESYEGRDTHLSCGNDSQDFLYCVVLVSNGGEAEIIDNGYRSYEEAVETWPDAAAKPLPSDRDQHHN